MKKDLKSALREYYAVEPPNSNPEGMKQTIFAVRREMAKVTYTDESISFWTFFGTQIRFIRKKVWFMQFFTVVLCGFMLRNHSEAKNTVGMISAFLPFLFLASTGELSRAFVYHTAEMELSTRFTLYQVMLSRITILGLTDVFLLTIMSAVATTYLSANLLFIFMYFCVPFLVTSFGCLFILNHVHTGECNYYCGAWGGSVVAVSFCLAKWMPALYEASLIWCWCVLFVIALLGAGFESYSLLKNCKRDVLGMLQRD